MVSKLIEHSIRKISFSINEELPWTEQDEQLIKTYIGIHDYEQQIQDTGKILSKETTVVNKEIEQVQQEVAEVGRQIKDATEFADIFILPDPKKEEKANQIFERADKVCKTINVYQQLLTKLEGSIEKFCELKSEYLDKIEDFSLWEVYDNATHEHSTNYETNSIDIVSFQEEDEKFRDYISVHKDRNESVFDYADEVIENYNALIAETKIYYATWEEFLKRIHLMRAIIESSGNTIITSAN